MWTTLAGREYGIVDTLFKVLGPLYILAEEDETSSWTAQSLVAGGGESGSVKEAKA